MSITKLDLFSLFISVILAIKSSKLLDLHNIGVVIMVQVSGNAETNEFTLEKPIEAVFVNICDLVSYSCTEENGRVNHVGVLKNDGSFSVSYDAETGVNPTMQFIKAVTTLKDSDTGDTVVVLVRKMKEEAIS